TRHSSGDGGATSARRSRTTKSLPAPCILLKRSGGKGGRAAIAQPPAPSSCGNGPDSAGVSASSTGSATASASSAVPASVALSSDVASSITAPSVVSSAAVSVSSTAAGASSSGV